MYGNFEPGAERVVVKVKTKNKLKRKWSHDSFLDEKN